MSTLDKFFSYLSKREFDHIGEAFAERIPWWLYHSGYAFMFELNRSGHRATNSNPELPTGYTCRCATRDEMPACSRITGLDIREYYRRFDAGDICFGVFVDGRPVNINWVHSGACYIRGMGFVHDGKSDDKYLYGIMTDPAERGKGLYKNCLVNLAAKLFGDGAQRIIQMVEDGNTPVLVTLPQLGYHKTHEIRHKAVLGFKGTTVNNLSSGQTDVRRFVSTPSNLFVI